MTEPTNKLPTAAYFTIAAALVAIIVGFRQMELIKKQHKLADYALAEKQKQNK